MGIYLDQVPAEIRDHLRQITKTSGLPDTEDSVEMIAQGWLEKKERSKRSPAHELEEVELLEQADERGCLAMTYSGSLLNIGPVRDGARWSTRASGCARTCPRPPRSRLAARRGRGRRRPG